MKINFALLLGLFQALLALVSATGVILKLIGVIPYSWPVVFAPVLFTMLFIAVYVGINIFIILMTFLLQYFGGEE